MLLEIKDLHVCIEDKVILNGVNLSIKPGEIHAIMGPNGAGKSTLANVLSGDPLYEVTSGEVWLNGKNVLELAPEERAWAGLFMGFQYPLEVAGISNFQFLHAAYNAKCKSQGSALLSEEAFETYLSEKVALLEMKEEFKTRNLNEGFSGGEKKRNEILQMAVLEPVMTVLDETDSGLDIDAIRAVSFGIQKLLKPEHSLLLITHYQRLLDYLTPHFVHVMIGGQIVQTGGADLALQLEEKGYDNFH